MGWIRGGNKIDEYWKQFYYDNYIDGAANIYGDKDIESCEDVAKRRLFFDWFIHDYIIPDKRATVIRLFLREYENRLVDELERNTATAWSNSVFRFFEILDIKRGAGYKGSWVIRLETYSTRITNFSYMINLSLRQ